MGYNTLKEIFLLIKSGFSYEILRQLLFFFLLYKQLLTYKKKYVFYDKIESV